MKITLRADDLVIAAPDIAPVTTIERIFAESFEIENCGNTKLYWDYKSLGAAKGQAIRLSQSNYAESVLQPIGMEKCKATCLPMQTQIGNNALHDSPTNESISKESIEGLLYLWYEPYQIYALQFSV